MELAFVFLQPSGPVLVAAGVTEAVVLLGGHDPVPAAVRGALDPGDLPGVALAELRSVRLGLAVGEHLPGGGHKPVVLRLRRRRRYRQRSEGRECGDEADQCLAELGGHGDLRLGVSCERAPRRTRPPRSTPVAADRRIAAAATFAFELGHVEPQHVRGCASESPPCLRGSPDLHR